MKYIALYRKYRPDKFEDIVGQENIANILKSQVDKNKVSHAYIFSGSRGTGKTSAAKVFSRAVNCLNLQKGEPCNECEACKSIIENETTDVVEMDAASNNSVDNIRQIRSEVVYASSSLKYRVYIIDEVHMLTTSAFNALLKTLEEPPENVIFILATTEQHKIPVTILSRCLRFEFNKIPNEKIVQRLIHVLKQEKVEYDQAAVEYIAHVAEGALRDALSILDRCLSDSKKLELNTVQEIVGATPKEVIDKLVKAIIEYDNITIIEAIDDCLNKGKDLRQLVYELTAAMLELLINSKEDKTRLICIIDELSKLDNDIRQSTIPNIVVKSSLVRITNKVSNNTSNEVNIDLDGINKRLQNLENQIAKGITVKEENKEMPIEKQAKEIKINKEETKSKVFKDFEKLKQDIVALGKLKLFSALAGAKMYIEEQILVITDNDFAYKMLLEDEQKKAIKQILKDNYEIDKNIIIKLEKKNNINKMEKLLNDNNVEYIDMD